MSTFSMSAKPLEEEEEEVYVWSNSGGSYVAGKDPSPAPSPVKSPFDGGAFDANYHMPTGCAQFDPEKCFVPALYYQGYYDNSYGHVAHCSPGPERYSYSSMSPSRCVSQINPNLSPSKVPPAAAPRVSVVKPSAPLVKKPSPKPEIEKFSSKKIRHAENYCLSDTEDDGDDSGEAESVYDRDSWVLETCERKTPVRRRGISQVDKNRLANLLRQTPQKRENASAASTADDTSARETDSRALTEDDGSVRDDDVFATRRSDDSTEHEDARAGGKVDTMPVDSAQCKLDFGADEQHPNTVAQGAVGQPDGAMVATSGLEVETEACQTVASEPAPHSLAEAMTEAVEEPTACQRFARFQRCNIM